MRVAALYDIHGNLPALEAVLAEAGDVDAIVVGGDITEGPYPSETLDRVLALGERAHVIRGNWDRIPGPGAELLAGLPLTVTLEVDGLGLVCFCHATPRSDDELFTERDPDELVAAMLAGTPESTIVCGHTHLQLDRCIGGKRVVNAGSVGFPHDGMGAHWARLGPDVELRQTDYDRAAAYERFVRSDWYAPGRPAFLVESMKSPVSRTAMLDFLDTLAARQRGR